MSRKNSNSTTSFWKIFKIYFLICIALLILLFIAEFAVLKNFQKKYDNNDGDDTESEWFISQQAFEEYIGNLNADDWARLWKESVPGCFDSDETLAGVMQDVFLNGDLNYTRAAGYTDERPAYVVENSEKSLVEFQLEKDISGEWCVTGTEFRFTGDKSAEITVPAGCSVFCNGIPLDDSFHDEGQDNYYIKQQLDDINNRVLWYTWRVEGQLAEPELTYTAPEGKELYTDNHGLLTVCLPEGEMTELYDMADAFFDDFHRFVMYGYFSDNSYVAQAASHTRTDSQAYESIYSAYDAVKHAPCYGEYDNDLTLSPIIYWGDNALSIDITYHTDARHLGEVTQFDGVYKLYFLDYGNGYELCGLLMQ